MDGEFAQLLIVGYHGGLIHPRRIDARLERQLQILALVEAEADVGSASGIVWQVAIFGYECQCIYLYKELGMVHDMTYADTVAAHLAEDVEDVDALPRLVGQFDEVLATEALELEVLGVHGPFDRRRGIEIVDTALGRQHLVEMALLFSCLIPL